MRVGQRIFAAGLATAVFALGGSARPIAHAAASSASPASKIGDRPFLPLDVVVPGSVLVRALDGRALSIAGAHRVALLGDGATERWDFDRPLDAAQTLAARDALAADPGLRVDVDLYRQAQLVPDDEGYKNQWPLHQLHAEQAWDVTVGDPDLVVAVVDTGVILDHPDLRTRLIAGYDFITDPGNAGDGDGRDPSPADAGDESEASSGFHGTHIAGIIGAATGNAIGMAGVDWRCHLQPVRVLGVNHHAGKDSDIADGIRWAAGLNVPGAPQNQTPAKVINLSFGGPGYSQLLQDAVLAARARGSIVIASAGNSHTDALTNVPGALEGVMSVAAAGPDGALASYSNFGARVDVLSPGGSFFLDAPVGNDTPGAIWSTSYVRPTRQAVFAYAAGTSQAAAYASGVAALVRAAAPMLKPDVVAAVMRRGAAPPKGNCEEGCGDGLLDARASVEIAARIAVTTCGAVGCGNSKMQPGPLHPEEGCAVARRGPGLGAGTRDAGGAFALLVIGAALRRRRRRAARSVGVLPLLALLTIPWACASKDDSRQAQSAPAAPTVRIKDPVPTLRDGDLQISLGAGRTIEVEVTPLDELEQVELHASSPDQSLGRLGHPPFRFTLPAAALGEGGRRPCCITATDARAQIGETCFTAVP